MRLSAASQPRVFLTFAAGDVPLVRPISANLQAGGSLALDEGFSSGPFAGARGEIIRASLLARLRRCSGALCLFRPGTLDDDWVLWTLTAAQDLKLPLLGAALPGAPASESERLLTGIGVEMVALRSDAIAMRARAFTHARHRKMVDAASIAETLHLMRRPLR